MKWIFTAFVFVSTLGRFSRVSPARRRRRRQTSPWRWRCAGPGRCAPSGCSSAVGTARRPGIYLWCALAGPPCSTVGVSHLATFCSLKSTLFLSQYELCPVCFLAVFPSAHGRGTACERVSSGPRSGSHVLAQMDKDGQVELFLQNEDEWFWRECTALSVVRFVVCYTAWDSAVGPCWVFCWTGASLWPGELARGPGNDESTGCAGLLSGHRISPSNPPDMSDKKSLWSFLGKVSWG